MKKTAEEFISGTFKYDKLGQMIWLINEKGDHQRILDLRGWGAIQHFFEAKNGTIDMEAAGKFQDEVGELIVSKLNASQSLPPVSEEEIIYDEKSLKAIMENSQWLYDHKNESYSHGVKFNEAWLQVIQNLCKQCLSRLPQREV